MKTNTEILRVTGDYCKKTTYMSWDCPFESQNTEMWVQGELYFNKITNRFEHEFTNEDGEVLYIVESQKF